jgi:hypothetical protein
MPRGSRSSKPSYGRSSPHKPKTKVHTANQQTANQQKSKSQTVTNQPNPTSSNDPGNIFMVGAFGYLIGSHNRDVEVHNHHHHHKLNVPSNIDQTELMSIYQQKCPEEHSNFMSCINQHMNEQGIVQSDACLSLRNSFVECVNK